MVKPIATYGWVSVMHPSAVPYGHATKSCVKHGRLIFKRAPSAYTFHAIDDGRARANGVDYCLIRRVLGSVQNGIMFHHVFIVHDYATTLMSYFNY